MKYENFKDIPLSFQKAILSNNKYLKQDDIEYVEFKNRNDIGGNYFIDVSVTLKEKCNYIKFDFIKEKIKKFEI
jgi:hypothetical protein